MNNIGVVVIGRNEGVRLLKCLQSLVGKVKHIVYVDSGSTDDSVVFAQNAGVDIVHLDVTIPFTAARARNAGAFYLLQKYDSLDYFQFVDGDCEVVNGWLDQAIIFLNTHPSVAVVCGRRRERFPDASIYNRLCDIEWNTPIGDAKACGGDALMRCDAFKSVNGFRGDLIAGEEPELCIRLRFAGYKVHRLEAEMTLHDAAMTSFKQWWRRTTRGGYAFALGAYLHGSSIERHWVVESKRAWVWGLFIPLIIFVLSIYVSPKLLWMLLIYPMQLMKIALRGRYQGVEKWWNAFFLVLSKFPELMGQIKFLWHLLFKIRGKLIEYK
ncbi:MAG: glycosyltransferase [Methylotenera sp.]|nr:glycosyltransferase [Methylotenera sp.]